MDSRSSRGNTRNPKTSNTRTTNTRTTNLKNTDTRNTSVRTGDQMDIAYRKRVAQRSNAKKRQKRMDFVPVFFILMFLYLGVHIIYFATKEKYPLYEVPRAEAINENISLQGMIIRDEVSFTATQKGYINYYIASGRRAAKGATIYTLDQNGEFSNMILSASTEEENLSSADLKKIVQRIKNLQNDFDSMDFQKVYDTKSAISAIVMDALTAAAIEKLNATMGITGFTRIATDRSGIVSFTCDSYDGLKEEQLTLEHLKGNTYSKIVSTAGDEKEVGEFVYKLVTDESFSIYCEMDEEMMRNCGLDTNSKKAISTKIYLNKIDVEMTVNMAVVQVSDGKGIVKLSIPKYGSNYIDDRYLEFELVRDDVYAIKIPSKSIAQKEYFLIPSDFVPTGEGYAGNGVLKQTATGEAVFVKFDSYKIDSKDGKYYVWSDELQSNDIIIKVDSEETYKIQTTMPVDGVYEANQGYTEFKIVTILQQDENYCLIKPKVSFGIAPFDYIVIEASRVTEGQVLE